MMSRTAVVVSRPQPDRVELLVATRTGAVLLSPDDARALAAELLVAADRAEGVEDPPLEVLGEGGVR